MRRFIIAWLILPWLAPAQASPKIPVPVWPGNQTQAIQQYKGTYVFLSPEGNTLIVLVPKTGSGEQEIARVPLHNQIQPTVLVTIAGQPGDYLYNYTVTNGPTAKDSIGTWCVIVPKDQFRLTMKHPGGNTDPPWTGAPANAVVAKQTELGPDAPPGRYALWTAEDINARVAPGSSLTGFQIQSNYSPGFTTGFVSSGDLLNLPQEWPDEVFKQLHFLEDRSQREQPLLTIGPMFSEDASAEQISQNAKLGIRRWVDARLLDLNAPFVQATLNALSDSAYGQGAQIKQRPQTVFEKMLAQLIGTSLRMNVLP